MSASNWRECPACLRDAKAKQAAAVKAADESYGKVPAADFINMRKLAVKPAAVEETLREDYELGVSEDGRFFMHYSGVCQTCSFAFKFRHEADALAEHDAADVAIRHKARRS